MAPKIFEILRFVAVLIGAAIIGNWFLEELKKTRAQKKPLYTAYLTIPGVLIIGAVIVLPIIIWLAKQ